ERRNTDHDRGTMRWHLYMGTERSVERGRGQPAPEDRVASDRDPSPEGRTGHIPYEAEDEQTHSNLHCGSLVAVSSNVHHRVRNQHFARWLLEDWSQRRFNRFYTSHGRRDRLH